MFKKILQNFRKKLGWAIAGNIAFALSQWLIITILARFGSALDLGLYSLSLAITAPIILFLNFDLRTIIATDSTSQYNFSEYMSGRILHMLVAYIIIISVALIYSSDKKTFFVIILLGLVKIIEALSDICMGFFQKKENLSILGKSQLLRGIYSTIIFGTIYYLTKSVIASIIGLLIIMTLRLLLYDLKYVRKLTPVFLQFKKSTSWELIKMAWPLGVTALIGSLNANIPRYFLDYFYGIAEVGVYSALYYVLVASNLVMTPISLLAAPKIANVYQNGSNRRFLKINLVFIGIALFVFLLIFIPVLFHSKFILRLFYGVEFEVYSITFTILYTSILFGFINSFLNLSIISSRQLIIQSTVNLINLFITLSLGYYLIMNNGLLGASWALVLSRSIQTVLLSIILVLIIKKK
ncbi:oligosaccharide flippase family protein [Virgibacillus sp. W0181]|uniref:oligosaccharide flippase family protein n=1 Tax=Virgibacillus sp. W0181 TaxID=3391581 RepID=UPI003F45E92E